MSCREPGHGFRAGIIERKLFDALRQWWVRTVQVRYASVPIGFLETRPLAEEYTFRFLGAALAYAHSDHAASAAAEQPPIGKR
jgi:hypothetical protein